MSYPALLHLVISARFDVCLVLSCLVLSCLVLSCLVLSCLVLSCLVLSCLVLSCLVLSCLVLSCLVLSCLVLSCLVLSYLVFSLLQRYEIESTTSFFFCCRLALIVSHSVHVVQQNIASTLAVVLLTCAFLVLQCQSTCQNVKVISWQ